MHFLSQENDCRRRERRIGIGRRRRTQGGLHIVRRSRRSVRELSARGAAAGMYRVSMYTIPPPHPPPPPTTATTAAAAAEVDVPNLSRPTIMCFGEQAPSSRSSDPRCAPPMNALPLKAFQPPATHSPEEHIASTASSSWKEFRKVVRALQERYRAGQGRHRVM